MDRARIHTSTDGCLSCLHPVAVVNNAALDVGASQRASEPGSDMAVFVSGRSLCRWISGRTASPKASESRVEGVGVKRRMIRWVLGRHKLEQGVCERHLAHSSDF